MWWANLSVLKKKMLLAYCLY